MAKGFRCKELISLARRSPGMLFYENNFDSYCAYLTGIDLALEGALLAGFREWLVIKTQAHYNRAWFFIAKAVLDTRPRNDDESEGDFYLGLFDLLNEYITYREENSLFVVHLKYAEWLKKQSWYFEGLEYK